MVANGRNVGSDGNVLQSLDRFADPAVVHEEGHVRRAYLQSGAYYPGKFAL